MIASVGLKKGESKDIYLAEIRQVLKGKTDLKSFRLDLTKARDAQNADALRAVATQGKPALFFASEKPAQGGEPARNVAAATHAARPEMGVPLSFGSNEE